MLNSNTFVFASFQHLFVDSESKFGMTGFHLWHIFLQKSQLFCNIHEFIKAEIIQKALETACV